MMTPPSVIDWDDTSWPASRSRSRSRSHRFNSHAAFAAVLAIGAALRFWSLAARPGWQYDETVYTDVASNLLLRGQVAEHITYGAPWSPDLYQPPFYFIVLARWFAVVGPSIYHARILGVACSLVTLTVFWRLLARLHGDQIALVAMIPIVFDGWLLYVQRVSYIENMLLALITCGMLLYQRALDGRHAGSLARFALAGAVLGFAVVFKYTGVYVVVAVLLVWLIYRHDHLGHLMLLSVALTVAAVFLMVEIKVYDAPGHDWWVQETMVQVRRVFALQSSGGTLTSPAKALHLLAAEYKVFIPSFLVAMAAFTVGLRRLWQCYRARDWAPGPGERAAVRVDGRRSGDLRGLLTQVPAVFRADPAARIRVLLD